MSNLYELSVVPDAPARKWCGGNLGGDNETCMTTRPLSGVDAFVVGGSKPEDTGHELRMTGPELDSFALKWIRERGLTA